MFVGSNLLEGSEVAVGDVPLVLFLIKMNGCYKDKPLAAYVAAMYLLCCQRMVVWLQNMRIVTLAFRLWDAVL